MVSQTCELQLVLQCGLFWGCLEEHSCVTQRVAWGTEAGPEDWVEGATKSGVFVQFKNMSLLDAT